MRRCSVHGAWVLEGDAVLLRMTETGSGPGQAVYACHPCVIAEGLVPQLPRATATFIGHRNMAPTPAGAA
jgi:hypothetical protein